MIVGQGGSKVESFLATDRLYRAKFLFANEICTVGEHDVPGVVGIRELRGAELQSRANSQICKYPHFLKGEDVSYAHSNPRKKSAALEEVTEATSSKVRPRTSASVSAVCFTIAGSQRFPLKGTGAR